MRRLLLVAAVLVFLAGVQLFVFSTRTEEYFAWTVDPPLTAAFLGAAYWASVSLELIAARARLWAHARIAVPTVFVFTTLTLVVTLVHLDRFHLGSGHAFGTRAVTWAWIAIYATVPVLMVVLFAVQARAPGGDPPRAAPLARWLSGLVGAQAALLLVYGSYLLVSPTRAGTVWPWALTPLTARAIGAWVFSLGVAAAHSLWEADAHRLRPASTAYVAFALLESVALLQHGDDVDWGEPQAYVLVVFLVSALVSGLATMRTAARGDVPSRQPVTSNSTVARLRP